LMYTNNNDDDDDFYIMQPSPYRTILNAFTKHITQRTARHKNKRIMNNITHKEHETFN